MLLLGLLIVVVNEIVCRSEMSLGLTNRKSSQIGTLQLAKPLQQR